MRVVVCPDSFGGTLTAPAAASAVAAGWRRARPQDDVVEVPLSDGGEGLLDVLCAADPTWQEQVTEVCGPNGHPRDARWLLRGDGTAVVESAEACGLRWVPEDRRTPMTATTWGVGQLLAAAHAAGARRVLLGAGGSASVDGGTGALSGLGWRLTVEDGSGLKVGGADLHRVAGVGPGWRVDLADVDVVLLADVRTPLHDAAATFGPQKGAGPEDVTLLAAALRTWERVCVRDLGAPEALSSVPGTGAAGGLTYGLAAALGVEPTAGAPVVADLVGLADALARAEIVVTGEGALDATSAEGKVLTEVLRRAAGAGTPVLVVAGRVDEVPDGVIDAEASAPAGAGSDPAAEVADAAARLAGRRG
ncbi:MAG: glycerate kinase [Actinomycetes bacterium]